MPLSPLLYRLAVVALLAWSTAAEAQPAVARVHREQQLVLSELPALGVLPLRLFQGQPTLLRFDAEVDFIKSPQASFESIVWVDVARQTVVLEPLRELAPGETLPLEVFFKKGTVPSRLLLQLVSHPGEVDSRVEVQLRPRLVPPLLEPTAATPKPKEGLLASFVHSDLMAGQDVTVDVFDGDAIGNGVIASEPVDYRTALKRAIAVKVYNPPGGKPWMASGVAHLSVEGVALPTDGSWTVHLPAPIKPGEHGLVVVEGPLEHLGALLRLEVREKGGERHVLLEGR